MDKRDIYEHLAKIYLDASLKRKKKPQEYPKIIKNIFLVNIIVIFGLAALLFTRPNRSKTLNSETTFVLCPEVVKINFNFDPVRKEIYSIGLNKLDLTRFKVLGFSAKTANYLDNIFLRIEFTSTFKEKAEVYLKNISHRWQDYKINLSEFKNISDWSDMLNLSFIVEEWNVKEKRGVIYIDNVRLSK